LLEANLEAAVDARDDQMGLMAVQSETAWVKAGAEFEQEPHRRRRDRRALGLVVRRRPGPRHDAKEA
jgi:regulation of enolase protein 1 (concanavalin A-like superfamily)